MCVKCAQRWISSSAPRSFCGNNSSPLASQRTRSYFRLTGTTPLRFLPPHDRFLLLAAHYVSPSPGPLFLPRGSTSSSKHSVPFPHLRHSSLFTVGRCHMKAFLSMVKRCASWPRAVLIFLLLAHIVRPKWGAFCKR